MPGKRKKDRKLGKSNKPAHKFAAADQHQPRNGAPASKPFTKGSKKQQPQVKTFTLKDEAAKSTYRSSKRLWQGEGLKLRNSPVEFVQAVEKYDPGQFLRDQIAANAKRQLDNDATDTGYGLGLQRDADIGSSIVKMDFDVPEDIPELSDDVSTDEEASPEDFEVNTTIDQSSAAEHESAPSVADMSEASPDEADVASAVDGLRLDSPEQASAPTIRNVDFILDTLQADEDEDEVDPDDEEEVLQAGSAEDDESTESSEDEMQVLETQSSTDAELFVIDTDGDTNIRPASPADETILLQPRLEKAQAPQPIEAETTPWARTIDDPMEVSHSPSNDNNFAGGHAFECHASSSRGRRGGRKKQAKIARAHAIKRQDEIDVMFDYMDNANWTDEEDDDEEVEPFITQMLAQAGGIDFGDEESPGLDVDDEENEDTASDSEESEDDTDIDDDLELMIDAEMEEMEFDLGYSGGRSSKGSRYGAHREVVDHALYHEDFNVYQYNSEDEGEEEMQELGASGARQRGLNKFVNSLDLSDEELEASLIAQWKKDRGSKKEKKRQRQKLHQQGLIGKKAKRARASHEVDTKSNGDLDAYHSHIKRFVSHADYVGIEQLPMPAMDKAVRRAVHVLSQAYGLKSASQGSGKRRHIILYKTKHAAQLPEAEYLEETLFRARRSLGFNSKYRDTLLPEAARQKLGRSGRPMKSGRDGGGGGGGRLRDGDLVGADAPEIHVANKGRQMLEKLGWMHGSGLGAVGKEGINLPLFATIKNSKHGLQ